MTRARFPHSEIPGSQPGRRLPEAYRSLPRPSSAPGAKASTVALNNLTTHEHTPPHPQTSNPTGPQPATPSDPEYQQPHFSEPDRDTRIPAPDLTGYLRHYRRQPAQPDTSSRRRQCDQRASTVTGRRHQRRGHTRRSRPLCSSQATNSHQPNPPPDTPTITQTTRPRIRWQPVWRRPAPSTRDQTQPGPFPQDPTVCPDHQTPPQPPSHSHTPWAVLAAGSRPSSLNNQRSTTTSTPRAGYTPTNAAMDHNHHHDRHPVAGPNAP